MGRFGIDVLSLAKTASDTAGILATNAAGKASKLASGAVHTAEGIASNVADTASTAAGIVSNGVKALKENTKEHVAFEAKKSGFKDGLNEGASLMAGKLLSRTYALFALGLCMARCDGNLSDEELHEIKVDIDHVLSNGNVPQAVRMDLYSMAANEELVFDDVVPLLDTLDCKTLLGLHEEMKDIAEADGVVTSSEEALIDRYESYVRSRVKADTEIVIDANGEGVAEEEANNGR